MNPTSDPEDSHEISESETRRPIRERPTKPLVDMGSIIAAGQIKGEFGPKESRAEQESRLRLKELAAEHDRRKEILILYATLVGLGVVILVCLVVAIASGSPENQKWAMSIVSSVVAFGLGYLVRGRDSRGGV